MNWVLIQESISELLNLLLGKGLEWIHYHRKVIARFGRESARVVSVWPWLDTTRVMLHMDGMDIWMASLYFIWTPRNNVTVKNIPIHSFQERDIGPAKRSTELYRIVLTVSSISDTAISLQRTNTNSFCEKWRIELFGETLYKLH